MILIFMAACQPVNLPVATVAPSDEPPTPDQLALPASPVPRLIVSVMPQVTPTAPLAMPSVASSATADTPGILHIGYSAGGRAINAWHLGQGPVAVLLVGGIHGGREENTVRLMQELIAYFEANPHDLLPNISLFIVPAANPDGLASGEDELARFNAQGVDLNRNWGCGWAPDARWRDRTVDAGGHAFSEPETRALAAFIQTMQPAAVLFYHSAAGGIFTGECDGLDAGAADMAQVLGEATGYTYGAVFSAYPVTGTAPSWVVGLGIPAADVELLTSTQSEFERNLRGIHALQQWVLATQNPTP